MASAVSRQPRTSSIFKRAETVEGVVRGDAVGQFKHVLKPGPLDAAILGDSETEFDMLNQAVTYLLVCQRANDDLFSVVL